MSVFNEAEWIERAILSVGNHVDRIIILDGAYENFMKVNNLDFFLSNDGTKVRREMRDRYVEFMNKRGWAE